MWSCSRRGGTPVSPRDRHHEVGDEEGERKEAGQPEAEPEAVNDVRHQRTGIVVGAIVPLVIGWLGDLVELRLAMTLLYLTLDYILSIGFWARPLITNATIRGAKKAEA